MNTTQSKLSNAISAITGLYGIIGTFYSLPYSYASGIAALVLVIQKNNRPLCEG
ncbi:hypothetical protein [Clostridium cochlearium]|uniref:hypothetical protein n=1 Tax=Clostridium cochlearium TaxID=1494 RepID=UPI0024200669|nr:hypothetical protein [Clostridium cochlearium]